MSEHERLEKVIAALKICLAELDEIGAELAAVHIDSALQALKHHSRAACELSDTE